MTPIAVTPAARGKKTKPRGSKAQSAAVRSAPQSRGQTPGATSRATGHKRSARVAAPPRRVSGPAAGQGRGTTRRSPAPTRTPRRTSGPVRRGSGRPALSRAISARLGRFVRGLPDHPVLDQIVRGRAWIPLLGILLVGIVAMQVEVLKLSANMGRSLERGTALQSRNEQLRASVAQLGDDRRIERIAAGMGMVMPPPAAVKFLAPRPSGQMARAVAGVHPPDAAVFNANLPSSQTATAGASGAATTLGGSTAAGGSVTNTTTPGVPTSTTPAVGTTLSGTGG